MVCTVHEETRSMYFLVEPQNQGPRFVNGLTSKPLAWFVSCLVSQPLGWFVSGLLSKPLWWFLLVWPQNRWLQVFWLGLKTNSYGLMICASKSLRQFFGLDLKIKRATICRLRHKTDGRMKTAWDTRRDLADCFTWKQVGLEFPSLASRLVEAQRGWCRWHGDQVEDGRVDATGCVGPCYPYLFVFFVLDHRDILVFCLGI
jgi:hypothetical protein